MPSTTPVFPNLTGRVVDAEGFPLPGAHVIAERAGYVRQGVTSKRGEFKLRAVTQSHYAVISGPPGVKPPPWFWQHEREHTPLTLTASAPGYEPATQTIPCEPKVPFVLVMPSNIEFQLFMTNQRAVAIPE
ncbi:carboxypeptidase-like regulatory domain-containing protein [Brevifollis gellanilyticus]|uniref:Carboxypeptidase regulatory-like domain-containing protein n=1 Tax=Brevifollis gellanilyticus TaxID=748831 RepID=A0A512M730_9BACT|nr:carboxypeptidase-like regulatory domain-containing protein [Brevifollis gellanilyticus]GEP42550.1 hypothetical protein BGE01nite_18410 [Brevifollis gellanilyticus]